MIKSAKIIAALAALSTLNDNRAGIKEAQTRGKNPNNPAVKLAEKKRAMRAEKLKQNMKGGKL